MSYTEDANLMDDVLKDHTLSPQYFFGYTTSYNLLSEIDNVVIEPYSTETRDSYIYVRNHHLRTWVDGSTKHIEVPSALLASQVEKVHSQINQSSQFHFEVENRVHSDESIYKTTDSMLGSDIESFFQDLSPAGHVVLCRPEEVLVEGLGDRLDNVDNFLEKYIASSSKYLHRIDNSELRWEDVYESYDGIHPKFRAVDEMIERLHEQTEIDLEMATAKDGIFRGYRFSIDGTTLTLLCRGWGRDMTHAMVSRLLNHTRPESVLFTGGCGAVQPELELNQLVLPETVHAPGEPKIQIDNAYLHSEWARKAVGDNYVQGTAYNVNSPVDETNQYMMRLKDAGKACVSMENYGVAKALKQTDIPLGILLFVMDTPMSGLDLGSTNYDPQKRGDITFVGNSIASQVTAGWHNLCQEIDTKSSSE